MATESVFLPGELHEQRSLEGDSPWGCKESDTTEQRSTQVLFLKISSSVMVSFSSSICFFKICIFFLFIYLTELGFSFNMKLIKCGIQFPGQGSNPGPLNQEHRVLATGPPGKSHSPLCFHLSPSLNLLSLSFFLFCKCLFQHTNHLPMQEFGVRSLGWEDNLEKEMTTHSNILAWEIPWTEEPGGLQFTGSQRVGQD